VLATSHAVMICCNMVRVGGKNLSAEVRLGEEGRGETKFACNHQDTAYVASNT